MAEIRRPPLLRVRHYGVQVLNYRIEIEALEFFGVIELLAHRIGQRRVLMKHLEVQLVRPPVRIGVGFASAVRYGALAFARDIVTLGDGRPRCSGEFFLHKFILLRISPKNCDEILPHEHAWLL